MTRLSSIDPDIFTDFAKNKEAMLAKHREYNATNREKVNAANAEYKKRSTAKVKAARAEYKKRNRATILVKAKEYRERKGEELRTAGRIYVKANAGAVNANTARRRAARMQATPAWANDFILREAYALAKLRAKKTGGVWHVDHIVPLNSKLVCGLHCEANLRVVRREDNQSKGNRYWPGMPC